MSRTAIGNMSNNKLQKETKYQMSFTSCIGNTRTRSAFYVF